MVITIVGGSGNLRAAVAFGHQLACLPPDAVRFVPSAVSPAWCLSKIVYIEGPSWSATATAIVLATAICAPSWADVIEATRLLRASRNSIDATMCARIISAW
jgi:hypothetical protein